MPQHHLVRNLVRTFLEDLQRCHRLGQALRGGDGISSRGLLLGEFGDLGSLGAGFEVFGRRLCLEYSGVITRLLNLHLFLPRSLGQNRLFDLLALSCVHTSHDRRLLSVLLLPCTFRFFCIQDFL